MATRKSLDDDEDQDERTSAYMAGKPQAAIHAPAPTAQVLAPEAPAPVVQPLPEEAEDGAATQAVQRSRTTSVVDAYGHAPSEPIPTPEAPTLAPREPLALPEQPFTMAEATTSVIVVDPLMILAARTSSPGPLPVPPPPAAAPIDTEQMGILRGPPTADVQTMPLGAHLPPEPMSGISRMPVWTGGPGALHTEPMEAVAAAPPAGGAPAPELRSPSYPRLSLPFPPEAISVGAQSISQVTGPQQLRSARIGRAEMAAIGGAVLTIFVVAFLVLRTVLGESPQGPATLNTISGHPATGTSAPPTPSDTTATPVSPTGYPPDPTQAPSSDSSAAPAATAAADVPPAASVAASESPRPVTPVYPKPRDPGDKGAWKPATKPAARKP